MNSSPASASPLSSVAHSNNSASPYSPRASRRKVASNTLVSAPGPPHQRTPSSPSFPNRVLARLVADYNRRFASFPAMRRPGATLRTILNNASVVSLMNASSVTTTSCKWYHRQLQIHPQPRRYSFAGAKVQIHEALNGQESRCYRDTRIEHSNLAGG
jgi:hypothetical protein